jgi:hypothetical protein
MLSDDLPGKSFLGTCQGRHIGVTLRGANWVIR